MQLPKYEGSDLADATAQFATLMKDADALVAASQIRVKEIQVGAHPPQPAGGQAGGQQGMSAAPAPAEDGVQGCSAVTVNQWVLSKRAAELPGGNKHALALAWRHGNSQAAREAQGRCPAYRALLTLTCCAAH